MNETVQSGSVLVVDDNPLITNVLKSLLGSEGYQVLVANNGQEALNVLNSSSGVDLIICDVMMPSMDGYELHHKVREKSELSHIPFVFLTALGDRVEINKGKETGADDYMVKPFDPKELLALTKGKIQRARSLKHTVEERYDSYRKKVIHTLSHEFRTPLVAINTGTELLLGQHSHLDQKRVVNVLEAIQRGGQRLEKLVSDFMLIQQIEAGIAQRVFDSRKAKRIVAESVRAYFEARVDDLAREGFRLTLENHLRGEQCYLYEAHVFDILDRFLSNAMKFKREDSTIELHCAAFDGWISIEVRDRGIGLDVKRLKEAMDAFGQLDREKLEQQGSGLGLSIASAYARIQGGRIEFENRKEGGAQVRLLLPQA